jgi:hypothetical protein
MFPDLNGIIAVLVLIGLIIGATIFSIPAYLIGKHYGKQAVYNEAIQHKSLIIQYHPTTGDKLYIWK